MKAIISVTDDPKYSFFLPIVDYCWKKLNIDVICFMPMRASSSLSFAMQSCKSTRFIAFTCPIDKEATYAQCSRLYAGCLDLPEDEILITGDVDMALFRVPPFDERLFIIFGCDLVPDNQSPICYVSGKAKYWKEAFSKGRSVQKCLDDMLGDIECESFKSNYWAKDQEEMYKVLCGWPKSSILRAKQGTQFATQRLDRDDSFILERLSADIIDFHMNRPGYEDKNFNIILAVLQYFYPNESFQWLIDYRNEYIKLL